VDDLRRINRQYKKLKTTEDFREFINMGVMRIFLHAPLNKISMRRRALVSLLLLLLLLLLYAFYGVLYIYDVTRESAE